MTDGRSVKSLPVPSVSLTSSCTVVAFENVDLVEANTSTFSCSVVSEEDESNAFGESACGEPLVPHHLHLDFTPTEEDTDFIQKKCSDFWEYINSRHDLQGMMVGPEMEGMMVGPEMETLNVLVLESANDTVPVVPNSEPASTKYVKRPKTAVSVLQLVEEKGLIDRAFEAKLQKSRCSLGQQEYELGVQIEQSRCICPGPCWTCSNAKASEAYILCEEMQAWDSGHPKSMEPPGQPPAFGQNVMGPGDAAMKRKI